MGQTIRSSVTKHNEETSQMFNKLRSCLVERDTILHVRTATLTQTFYCENNNFANFLQN